MNNPDSSDDDTNAWPNTVKNLIPSTDERMNENRLSKEDVPRLLEAFRIVARAGAYEQRSVLIPRNYSTVIEACYRQGGPFHGKIPPSLPNFANVMKNGVRYWISKGPSYFNFSPYSDLSQFCLSNFTSSETMDTESGVSAIADSECAEESSTNENDQRQACVGGRDEETNESNDCISSTVTTQNAANDNDEMIDNPNPPTARQLVNMQRNETLELATANTFATIGKISSTLKIVSDNLGGAAYDQFRSLIGKGICVHITDPETGALVEHPLAGGTFELSFIGIGGHFRWCNRGNQPLGDAMDQFATNRSMPTEALEFRYGGSVISREDTPIGVDMRLNDAGLYVVSVQSVAPEEERAGPGAASDTFRDEARHLTSRGAAKTDHFEMANMKRYINWDKSTHLALFCVRCDKYMKASAETIKTHYRRCNRPSEILPPDKFSWKEVASELLKIANELVPTDRASLLKLAAANSGDDPSHSLYPYCEICKKFYKSKDDYSAHLRWKKNNGKGPIVCGNATMKRGIMLRGNGFGYNIFGIEDNWISTLESGSTNEVANDVAVVAQALKDMHDGGGDEPLFTEEGATQNNCNDIQNEKMPPLLHRRSHHSWTDPGSNCCSTFDPNESLPRSMIGADYPTLLVRAGRLVDPDEHAEDFVPFLQHYLVRDTYYDDILDEMNKVNQFLARPPKDYLELVSCAEKFFDMSKAIVPVNGGDVRGAVQQFSINVSGESTTKAIFQERQKYDDPMRYMRHLLAYLFVVDHQVLSAVKDYLNGRSYSVADSYRCALIPSILYSLNDEDPMQEGVPTVLMNHAVIMSHHIIGTRVRTKSCSTTGKLLATIVHVVRLCVLAKVSVLTGKPREVRLDYVKQGNKSTTMNNFGPWIAIMRASQDAKPPKRNMSVDEDTNDILIDSRLYKWSITERLIPKIMEELITLFSAAFEGERGRIL